MLVYRMHNIQINSGVLPKTPKYESVTKVHLPIDPTGIKLGTSANCAFNVSRCKPFSQQRHVFLQDPIYWPWCFSSSIHMSTAFAGSCKLAISTNANTQDPAIKNLPPKTATSKKAQIKIFLLVRYYNSYNIVMKESLETGATRS